MKSWKLSLGAVAVALFTSTGFAQNKYFGDWPAGSAPSDVGKRVAEAFIPAPNMDMSSHGPQALHYSHVATWTGALQFAGLTKDADLKKRLVDRFDPFLTATGTLVPRADHVDGTVFGALPLELYMREARFRYRVMGLAFADAQWDRPLPDGLSNQTRWWIDDMYMITALQLAAYRATATRSISSAPRSRWSRTSPSFSSRTASFSTRRTCPSTGAAAMAGWRSA